jgi:hypothetical protein
MNNVISHPTFAREPIVNVPRRGPCAKPLTDLRKYRRNKSYGRIAEQAAQARAETDAERADRLEATINQIAIQFSHLLKDARENRLAMYLVLHISRIVEHINESREVHRG